MLSECGFSVYGGDSHIPIRPYLGTWPITPWVGNAHHNEPTCLDVAKHNSWYLGNQTDPGKSPCGDPWQSVTSTVLESLA